MIAIIGLDGGTFRLLESFMNGGITPFLAGMRERGAWGVLHSTLPPHTAPAWATFMTGKNPGRHGIYAFRPLDERVYQGEFRRVVNSRSIPRPSLWELLGRAGKRVGLINVPLTYPPFPVNGFLITGMLTPLGSDRFTYPPALALSLTDYAIDIAPAREYGAAETLDPGFEGPELVRELRSLLRKRTAVALRLLREYAPDFFMLVFTETDRIQHYLWSCVENESHPLRPLLEDFYRELDACLEEVFEAAGREAVRIIMSDHGFGPSPSRSVYINVWLRERGLLRLKGGPSGLSNPRRWLTQLGVDRDRAFAVLRRFFPSRQLTLLFRNWGKRLGAYPIDWERSQAVFIPVFGYVGGIKILLPASSPAYESLRRQIIEGLWEIKDPQTGREVMAQVWPREEVYKGPRLSEAPDVLFALRPDYRCEMSLLVHSVVSARPASKSFWSGTHRGDGILLIEGPGIKRGALPPCHLEDLAPTLLYLMNVPIPADMDGRVIGEALEEGVLSRNPPRYAPPLPGGWAKAEWEEREKEAVLKRLRDLGYLE